MGRFASSRNCQRSNAIILGKYVRREYVRREKDAFGRLETRESSSVSHGPGGGGNWDCRCRRDARNCCCTDGQRHFADADVETDEYVASSWRAPLHADERDPEYHRALSLVCQG